MDKKKPEDKEGELPRNFEIVAQVSPVKIIREQDKRVQAASSLSVLLSIGLLVSVGALVYQATTAGQYDYYAQELRTGAFTELNPIAEEKKLKTYKMTPPPSYDEKLDLKLLEERLAHRRWLAALMDPEAQQARAAAEAAAAASAASATATEQAASAAAIAAEPVADAPVASQATAAASAATR